LLLTGEKPAQASLVDDLLSFADVDDTGLIYYEKVIKKVHIIYARIDYTEVAAIDDIVTKRLLAHCRF
jgi:hypothetical protein